MKTDGRQLHRKALDVIRALALQRIADGETVTAVMQSYGLCRTTVYTWRRKLEERGGDVLLSVKPSGRPPRLTPKQKAQVFRWLNGKDPRQFGFDFGLWTRQLVAALVQERFGVTLGVTAVGRLLAELGITPQKPLRRAYERDPKAVARWEQETYPMLRRRARTSSATRRRATSAASTTASCSAGSPSVSAFAASTPWTTRTTPSCPPPWTV